LDADYFTNTKCENIDDDCVLLLDAIVADGFAGQQPNQGADPLDWRSDAIANPVYLEVYPAGFADWVGVLSPYLLPKKKENNVRQRVDQRWLCVRFYLNYLMKLKKIVVTY